MEDLIACLYPYYETAEQRRNALRVIKKSSRYVLPQQAMSEPPSRRSREATVPPDENDNKVKKPPAHLKEPGLQLTFSHEPKESLGFVLGCDARCDIVLPLFDQISRRHCYITFDN